MSVLKRNIFANYAGQAALAAIALITVPLYLRFLGADGFGLVSFLLTLQAVTAIVDFGLSTTASREISRYQAQERNHADRRDLVRTLETFYYASGTVIFLAIMAIAPWLATNWFRSAQFDADTLRVCVTIAGATIALRWPAALYQGILRGTEQQVALNVTNTSTALLRGVGTIAVLVFVTHSIVSFYWWQLFFAFVELLVFIGVVQRHGSFTGRAGTFRWPILWDIWRFSTKVGGLSLFALVLKQVDKVLISRLLPISQLGFFSAASLASNAITKVAQPVQTAVFPRLTQLYERKDAVGLAATFHRCCQITAFVSVPFAAILLFFSHDVLWLWTRNGELAAQASSVLSVLAASMMLNSMMSVPFALQLAAGSTMLPLVTNAIFLCVMAPAIVLLVKLHGLVGAAYAWLGGNALYYLAVPPFIFRRVLPGHHQAWFTRDTLPFLVGGTACIGAARWASGDGSLTLKIAAVFAGCLSYAVAMLATNATLRKAVLASSPFALRRPRSVLVPSRD